ncbi:HTH domain-containing protein [Halorubrum halophilum]|uniref:HTH domain-containing protein n=1 Tax=Halorubrum halophilum TaxID=413816 RepID=UPI00374406B2
MFMVVLGVTALGVSDVNTYMSNTRKNFIKVQTSILVWVEEEKRGFSVSELAERTFGVSERTVRRCVEDLQETEYIEQKEDGLYYATMTLQPSIFH